MGIYTFGTSLADRIADSIENEDAAAIARAESAKSARERQSAQRAAVRLAAAAAAAAAAGNTLPAFSNEEAMGVEHIGAIVTV